jgi:hypothetical protein
MTRSAHEVGVPALRLPSVKESHVPIVVYMRSTYLSAFGCVFSCSGENDRRQVP